MNPSPDDAPWLIDLAKLVAGPGFHARHRRLVRENNRALRDEVAAPRRPKKTGAYVRKADRDPYSPDNPCPLVAYAGVIDRPTRKWRPPLDGSPGWFDDLVRALEDT